MGYDLRREAWIPFRRRDGRVAWGPPALLTDALGDNPVVALAAPRPDFDGALSEFLIGLLTAALLPEDEDAWRDLWSDPPTPEALQAAIDALPAAFDLDGGGPRFLQDIDTADFGEDTPEPIEALLIDAAGGNTTRLNKDLFVKRDRVAALGRAAAAMALIALQTYAPSGGQGHRTSMRGGGPLTTLIEPRVRADGTIRSHDQPLWRKLWANVETMEQWADRGPDMAAAGPEHAYPWLAPTRTSNPKAQGRATAPQDAHPLQAYFGMPRRIRLVFEDRPGGICDLTGRADGVLVTGIRTRNYGIEYDSWLHPLSPYYRDKKSGLLPLHGQPDGIGWRDWAALTLEAADDSRRPARCVSWFRERRARALGLHRLRLHAFGYDMDNMKARGWVNADLPAWTLEDAERAALVATVAAKLTRGAGVAANALRDAVAAAKGNPTAAAVRFWADTETAFFDTVASLLAPDLSVGAEILVPRGFAQPLARIALAVFDVHCPMEGLDILDARRLVVARHELSGALRGYGRLGTRLATELGLEPPATAKPKKGAAA